MIAIVVSNLLSRIDRAAVSPCVYSTFASLITAA
jgi:hypothetical protein